MTIRELMDVPAGDRQSQWLQDSLQHAIALELATIPVYLCGMWSIIDEDSPVRTYLSSIVLQEMLHMGLACNMLSTIGGVPDIAAAAPIYPGPLPGGVRPELHVWLAGLSRAMVRAVYMEVEYPEAGPITRKVVETYPTIGNFYDAILDAFHALPDSEFKKERQLRVPGLGGTGLFPVLSRTDAACAIRTIKEQGEGTSQAPAPSSDPDSRAHFYRFAELYYGRALLKKDGKWVYEGDEIPFPAAYPMAEVPVTGYPESQTFDEQYTDVLNLLHAAWERPVDGQRYLDKAILRMPSLGGPARDLMQKPLASGTGSYGPDFRLIPNRPVPSI
jgi:hypothetical protein